MPGEHIESVEFVEQPVRAEVSENATLNDALEPNPVLGLEEAGFGKVSVAVVASGEDVVEDDQVEVKVRVQGGAEAVQEADGSELRAGRRTGTGATEGGANRNASGNNPPSAVWRRSAP